MTSSVLAALISIGAIAYVITSGRKLISSLMILAIATLGYISGSDETPLGGIIKSIIAVVTSIIDWVAGAF